MFLLILVCVANTELYAQVNNDSIRIARQRKLDSTRAAQKRYADSVSRARTRILDSTRKAQQRYNDSMRIARERKLDSTRAAQKRYNDSVTAERKRILDSTRTAQKRFFDSMRVAREKRLDSMKESRQRISDSLAAIREYRSSDRYKDSVAAVRQARLDSIKLVRQKRLDSIKAERKRVTDSIVAVRKAYVDSIRAVQKKRSDSLAAIREYRQSKRYKDSVQVVRKMKLDSIKAVRTAYYDSIKTERQRVNDSIAAERKAYTDSIATVRKAYTDSLKEVRKVRADSLAKLKEKREKDRKVREKQREEKAKMALELKIKKKREAYNNEQMLKKRWGFPRSVIHNTFTRFNYYFNADQKMDEALDNMQRMRQDNYDSLLALFPFNPDTDSAVLAADMDSIIQKASLGIQIHDPRTKWGDDLYLLLGQAYFYKGDYENAEKSFKYVVSLRDKRKKKKNNKRSKQSNSIVQEEKSGVSKLLSHQSVHNEAILWLARTFTQQHKEGDAESILDLIETDPNFSGSLEGRVALEKAFIRLNQKDYRGAVAPLNIVADDNKLPTWVRIRSAYISGQILQNYEQYDSSANSFRQALALHPNIEMDFNAKKNVATSSMLAGGEQEESIAMLKGILKDGKYRKYFEQVYFLLGKLSLNGGDEENAIVYLKKGINTPKATDGQKAISYATLGDVYYSQKAYEGAKDAYDSASVYMASASSSSLTERALRRSVVLGNLTGPLRKIRYNDSLLHLASLSLKEQKKAARDYIKILEDKRADSIFRAENAGLTSALKNSNNSNNRKNNYANWYFTNPALMQKGYNEFKQKWGSRPLVDDWRRSSASVFAQNSGDRDTEEGNGEYDANGIPTEEYLLSLVPNDKDSKQQALDTIEVAYLAAANAYVNDLEDYPPALDVLDTLDKRFPAHEHAAEVLYLRYLIALRQNDLDKAREYSAQLLEEYPDSKWAQLAKPTEDGGGVADKNEGVVAYYDKTYTMLLDREFEAVLPRAKEGQKRFDVPVYKDRFQIIETIALASLQQYTKADSVLSEFMTKHTDPNDSLRRWADAVLKYINDNRRVMTTVTPGNSVDTTAKQGDPQKTQPQVTNVNTSYKYDPKEEHLVLFVFKNMENRTQGVNAAIGDFNKFKFGSLKLKNEIRMLNAVDGMVVIKEFTNRNQALIYMNSLKKTKQVFREYQSGEYNVVMISKSNFNKLLANKNMPSYLNFFRSKY